MITLTATTFTIADLLSAEYAKPSPDLDLIKSLIQAQGEK